MIKQAKQLGGSVRKGERSTPVVFWKWIERASEDSETSETETQKILGSSKKPAARDSREFSTRSR